MNWISWAKWASDHQSRILFLFFLIVGASHVFFAPIAAWRLLKMKPHFRVVRLVGILLAALAADGFCKLTANIDGPRSVQYTLWYAWWFWSGETMRWLAISLICWEVIFPKDKPTS